MSPHQPAPRPNHRSFRLTPERQTPLPHRIARGAIIIYLVTFLASGVAMCSCPGFFAVMAICAVVSLIWGSRIQRLLSTGFLLVAVIGFVLQYRAEQKTIERVRRVQILHERQIENQ